MLEEIDQIQPESQVFSLQLEKSPMFPGGDFAIATACGACEKWAGGFWTRSAGGRHNDDSRQAVGGDPREPGPFPDRSGPQQRWQAPVQGFLVSAIVLGLIVGVGIAAIVAVRARFIEPEAGHGDWESVLVGYKNLRDKGVLDEEEYRKISSAVEPLVRQNGASEPDRQPRSKAS